MIGGLSAGAFAQGPVSSDRFILKVVDRAISFQDINFQLRNLKGLDCVYGDSLVISYFQKSFIRDLDKFAAKFPAKDEEVVKYLHSHEELLKKIRYFFKMLRYSEDQKKTISEDLAKLIRESAKENKCDDSILYKDTVKTNFKSLMEMELYLRSRYEGQLRGQKRSFDFIRPSIDLFVDSLDKQFLHEYYW